ncbi:hypothetical protein [Histidinibacterium lentulum]|uniref:Uncharacterized protein n=1 Tax=Histidinibacterium lentulum TaxID=2480588 RepID=A0A3N2R156_9RHOB|nr:hypothetical protein [Histidinibacterium lentulum]ROU01202.1 hypothetical protein EAT49_11835 [Histidinibacterium lentulum]
MTQTAAPDPRYGRAIVIAEALILAIDMGPLANGMAATAWETAAMMGYILGDARQDTPLSR